jgi:hypothetical protein
MVREGPPEPAPPPQHEAYPADKARRGEIIPRPPGWLIVFVAAVTGAVLLLILLRLLA